MSRGLGKVQKLILDYLENKAKRSKIDVLRTVESYANAKELSIKLHTRSDVVSQAISSLIRRKEIMVYPNGRQRDRYYGSLILPSLTEEDIPAAAFAYISTITE